MKHILEVNVDDKGYGGVYSFVRNIIRYMDKNRFVVSICAFEPFEKEDHKRFVRDNGGEVFDCSSTGFFAFKQFISCRKFYRLLKEHPFDVIHIHSDVSYKLFLYGCVARLAGSNDIIVHSHSTGVEGKHILLKKCLQAIGKRILAHTSFYKVACSELAARWMYPVERENEIPIIKNGINIGLFRYSPDAYKSIRSKCNLSNKIVLGTVARFSYQKYPEKLLEVFRTLHQKNPNIVLLWVGMGPLRDTIMNKAKQYGIGDAIIFYGNSDRIQDLYQAMDIFILTSRFEGLCIAAVEAQAAGLPCLCSKEMSPETKLTDHYYSLSVQESNEIWADKLVQLTNLPRQDTYSDLKKAGYDLKDSVKNIEDIYDGKR